MLKKIGSITTLFISIAAAQPLRDKEAVNRVADKARDFTKYIPDFSCNESAHSEQVGRTNRPINWVMNITGTFRVHVIENGSRRDFKEERDQIKQDGVALPTGKQPNFPYLLHGAFGPALDMYLAPEHRNCLVYKLSTGRLDFEAAADVAARKSCSDFPPQTHGYMSFHPESGEVSHIERTIPDAIAAKLDFATFAAIDYLPSSLGDRVYPLPSHIIGRKRAGMVNQLFEAHYSGCKKFNSDSTFVAGPMVNEEGKQPSLNPEPEFQRPACKQNFKSRPCTPESVAFQKLGDTKYHVVLPANLGASLPNTANVAPVISNLTGFVCWDRSPDVLAQKEGQPTVYCNGPQGDGIPGGRGFMSSRDPAGKLVYQIKEGRTVFFVNGRVKNLFKGQDGRMEFRDHDGFFEFDVDLIR